MPPIPVLTPGEAASWTRWPRACAAFAHLRAAMAVPPCGGAWSSRTEL